MSSRAALLPTGIQRGAPTTTDVHGYAIDEAEVTWWGRCPACQTAAITTT